MKIGRGELWASRSLLIGLMIITILPFISIFTTALHPSGTVPNGFDWPADPQWGNFVEAFNVANMTVLLASSTFIVLAVVPISLIISTMAGFAIGHLQDGLDAEQRTKQRLKARDTTSSLEEFERCAQVGGLGGIATFGRLGEAVQDGDRAGRIEVVT